MELKTVCICGAGTMGSGIAQVTASAGHPTILYDLDPGVLNKAAIKLERDLDMLVEKKKITAENRKTIWQRLSFTSQIMEATADLIIEAVIEKTEVKVALFGQLARQNSPSSVFATNTSSLSVSDIARHVPHPARVAGLHFFNPAPVMKLVEVVKTNVTSDEVMNALVTFTGNLGKTPVVCSDSPGFIVNRVARPYYIESLRLLEEGIADVETIDRLMESRGFKMGPFRLMDLIGNDVNYAVSCSVYEQLDRPERLTPSYIQKEKVNQGALGKKTGNGYYQYDPNKTK